MQTKPIFATPEDAEAAFYDALEKCDLEAMMDVWAEDEEIVFVPPGGPRFKGLNEVREVWQQIFSSGSKLRIRTSVPVKNQTVQLAMHSVLEYVTIEGEGNVPPLIISTNIYLRGLRGWQMISHHTSPAPDESNLLAEEASPTVH